MNIYKLSLLSLTLIFVACGDDNKNNKTPKANSVKTVKEATKNLNVLNSFKSINFSTVSSSSQSATPNLQNKLLKVLTNKTVAKLQKAQTSPCADEGSMTFNLSEDTKTITYLFDNCKNDTSLMDGSMTMVTKDDNSYSIEYDKLTVKQNEGTQYMDIRIDIVENSPLTTMKMDGLVKQTSTSGEVNNISMTNLISKSHETDNESWHTIDGKIALENKCFIGAYQFKTIEKLVDAKDGSDNTQSGILELNGATYTFENPHVTVKAGSDSETMLQSELQRRMEAESGCKL